MKYSALTGRCFAIVLATLPLELELPKEEASTIDKEVSTDAPSSSIGMDLYDINKREVDGDKYYSTPYGTQQQYFVDPAPERGQYYREPTGKRTGYYTVPRGQSTYQKGYYDKGRFYVQPGTPYPGDKPHLEYQPNKE